MLTNINSKIKMLSLQQSWPDFRTYQVVGEASPNKIYSCTLIVCIIRINLEQLKYLLVNRTIYSNCFKIKFNCAELNYSFISFISLVPIQINHRINTRATYIIKLNFRRNKLNWLYEFVKTQDLCMLKAGRTLKKLCRCFRFCFVLVT